MDTDSEEDERMKEERLQSLVSEDESHAPLSQHPSTSQMSNTFLRQPIGFQRNSNNPPLNTYSASPTAPSDQYPPGDPAQRLQESPSRKSKSKSKSAESRPKKRKQRAPMQYIKWLPGDPPPASATMAAANTPGATTFVGDSSQYMSSDPDKLSPFAELAKRNMESKNINFNYYQPVEKVWASDRTRIMPVQTPELEGIDRRLYTNNSSTSQLQQCGPESNQEARPSSSSNGHKQHRSHHRGDHPMDQSNNLESGYRLQNQYQGSPSGNRNNHGRSSVPVASIPQRDPSGNPALPMHPSQRLPPPLRILTLLIEDLRRDDGERDLLAEIKVPLKKADNPEDGFWADAKEVCKELQSSPARIDGPAKAFTRRGKYKQYFLRVTARGTDEYQSANLRVDKERTLQVLIEAAPEPLFEPVVHSPRLMTPVSVGGASNSPRPFTSLKRKHDDVSRLSEPREMMSIPYSSPQSQYMHLSPPQSNYSPRPPVTELLAPHPKKPKITPTIGSVPSGGEHESVGDWGELPVSPPPSTAPDGAGPAPQPTTSAAAHEPNISIPEITAQLGTSSSVPKSVSPLRLDPPLDKSKSTPGYRGLVTGSESHKHTEEDTVIIHWLRSMITQEQGWSEFEQSRRKTLTVGEQLKQYRYIQNQFDRFEGKKTPPDLEGAPACKVTMTQVINSFGLRTAWGEACTETLKLMALYGPGGSRLEDPRVVSMIDEPPAVTTGMQMKAFLKLLRQVDEEWDNDHLVDSNSEGDDE